MMDQRQFDEYCQQLELAESSRAYLRRVRSSPPSRRVQSRIGNNVCRFPSKKMNFIDAHVHVWTPDTERYPLAPGFKKENLKPASFTPEELFKNCKPAGVGRINLIQMSFYGFDNSYMLDTMRAYPGKFSGVGIVDSTSSNPQQTMEDLAKHGVRGFRITPGNAPSTWLQTPGMEAMWRAGQGRMRWTAMRA